MTQAHNPFAGVRGAEIFSSGQYLEEGRYKFKIGDLIWKKLEAGGNALIVEGEILESTNVKHPVGAKRTWFQKENKSFKSEAKAFCYAACGYDHRNPEHAKPIAEKVEPNCETILFKALTEGVLRGRLVYVDVTNKAQANDPTKNFSKHTFSPADEKPLL